MSPSQTHFSKLLSGFLSPFISFIPSPPPLLSFPPFLFLPLLFTTSNLDSSNKKIFIIFFF